VLSCRGGGVGIRWVSCRVLVRFLECQMDLKRQREAIMQGELAFKWVNCRVSVGFLEYRMVPTGRRAPFWGVLGGCTLGFWGILQICRAGRRHHAEGHFVSGGFIVGFW
jgi:hypothetical protein